MLSLFIKISETYKMQQRRIEVEHVQHNPTQTTHVMSIAVRFYIISFNWWKSIFSLGNSLLWLKMGLWINIYYHFNAYRVMTYRIFCIDLQFLRRLAKYSKYYNPNSVDIHITNQNFERKILLRGQTKKRVQWVW